MQFSLLAELLRAGVSVVAEGNFSREEPFRALPPARIVQLFLSAPADLLGERYRSRSDRHPAHPDPEYAPEVDERTRRGDWRPLDLDGTLLERDTSTALDTHSLAEDVRGAAARSARPE